MAKASIEFFAIYFYISSFIANNYEASKLKIDYIQSTTKREQPSFNYVRHVVELRFHDKEYSRNESIYIPGAGVIIAPRFIITAAHLVRRGTVSKIGVQHSKCGKRTLAFVSFAETHDNFKGKPPYYDIALLLLHHEERHSISQLCEGLERAYLPKTFLAYNFGGRAILIGHEHYFEHFYFTTRRTRKTTTTPSTTMDPRYYSSEYYSDSEAAEPCCSTPRTLRLLRRRVVENVIRIQHCPADIDGYFFCSYEQNRTIPNEGDFGTGVIDRYGRLIGIFSFQRFATYGSNVNFYVDIAASTSWINPTMEKILQKEKDDGNSKKGGNLLRIL